LCFKLPQIPSYSEKQNPPLTKEFRLEFFHSVFEKESSQKNFPIPYLSKYVGRFRIKFARIKIIRFFYVFLRKILKKLLQEIKSKKKKPKQYKNYQISTIPDLSKLSFTNTTKSVYLVVPYFLEMNGPDSHYGELIKILRNLGLKVHYVATESQNLLPWTQSTFSGFKNVEIVFPRDLSKISNTTNSIFINCGSPWFYRNAKNLHAKGHILIDYLFNHVGHTKNNINFREFFRFTVCQHQALATIMSETCQSKSHYVCIPIPYRRSSIELRRKSELKSNPLWVGRFSAEKGIDRLTEIARLHHYMSGKPINVIGGGPLINEIKEEISNKTINYLGELSHIETLEKIADSKIVFNTSYVEGVSIVSLEALSLGSSFLSFNVGGMSDLLWHPGMNLWYEFDNLRGFTSKLSEINEQKSKKIGYKVPHFYTREHHLEEWKKLINISLAELE